MGLRARNGLLDWKYLYYFEMILNYAAGP